MKQCPECAEQIQIAAKVCRYCGHQFSEADISAAESHERQREIYQTISKALPIVLVLVFIWMCSRQTPDQPAASPVAAIDPKPCDELIELATKEGLVKQRPSPERVNVEDGLWAEFPASSKRGLALAVRCSATRGAPQQFDYGVIYGYRSGKRLAMATSVGVEFN